MRVNFVRVFVDDLSAARRFYADTLGWPVTFENEALGFIGLDAGVTVVLENGAESADLVGRFTGVSFWVDDIDKAFKDLKKQGVKFDGKPADTPWGGRLAHFKDPAGNTLSLITQKDA